MNTKFDEITKVNENDLEKEVLLFNRKKLEIIKTLKFISENDRYNINNKLKASTGDKIIFYLKYFKYQMIKNVHYEPARRNFDWWTGANPPGNEAYNVYEKRELVDYISLQNQGVEKYLSEFVQPLLEIVFESGSSSSYRRYSEYLFWKQINDEYMSKEKESSLVLLNDFILTNLTTITAEGCPSFVAPQKVGFSKSDFFALKQKEIALLLNKQCKKIIDNKIAYDFNRIANIFNEKLAGKFPFTDDLNMDNSDEVDENILKDYLIKFDEFIKNDSMYEYVSNAKDEKWKVAQEFINKMKNISSFIKNIFPDEKNQNNNSFDLLVDFNHVKQFESNTFGLLERNVQISGKSLSNLSSDKLITWAPSEEVSILFRWAKDYNQFPTQHLNNKSEKYYIDLNNKTISFTARNKWSLLYLLRKHALSKDDYYYSQNIVFKVPIKKMKKMGYNEKNIENSMSKIVLKVKFIDKNNKTAVTVPVFPEQAELLKNSSI